MAHRLHGGRIFLVPRAVRHNRRAVLANYVLGTGLQVREVDYDRESGMLDLAKLKAALSPDVCGVYVENPNFFGRFEEQLGDIRAMTDAIFVVGVNPIAQAVVRPPGDFGADIVIGEGQPLGTQMNFGGPLLGIFACRQEHIRKMPGRVIGLTRDAKGHRAFCMTLQTREQHIRREKAMSNICTNESLLAVAAAAYLSVQGANGLRRVAAENIRRAKELAVAIDAIPGFTAPMFHGAHFNEFVVRRKKGYEAVHPALLAKGVHGGLTRPTSPRTERRRSVRDDGAAYTGGRAAIALRPGDRAMSFRQAFWDEPLITEKRSAPDEPVDLADLVPAKIRRERLAIPNLSEHDVVRHFTRLSQMNFGIDTGFYPLGSCTMKFNPKFTEELAALPTVARIHPDQDESTVQGALRLLYELQDLLAKIAGMDAVTLQPAAGAQGEYTGLLLAQAYHRDRGEERHQVIIPDTAHGTNPASAGMLGFDLVEIPSKDGRVDLKALEAAAGDKTLALMLTNPNTLGIFEEHVLEIAQIVHDAGGLLYYDGANFNAILGRSSPGKMNFDIVHFNLHKTFTTPHGGGGPGAGPVGVKKPLEPFLPVPVIGLNGRGYHLNYDRPKSIGKVRAWYGNFALLVRAYAYILRMGGDGLKEVSERAVLNANYVRHRLDGVLEVPFGGLRKHEFVASAAKLAATKGVRTVDVAKRLMDFGYHPPTVYFPHLVEEALMIEPTETETKETLDGFVEALTKIVKEDPALLHSAPHNTAVARVDEVQAAREPLLSWRMAKARERRPS